MKLQAILFSKDQFDRLDFTLDGFCRFNPDVPVLMVNTGGEDPSSITKKYNNVSLVHCENIWHMGTHDGRGSFTPRFFEILTEYGRNQDYTHTLYLEDDVQTIKRIVRAPKFDLAGITGERSEVDCCLYRHFKLFGIYTQCGQGGSIVSNQFLRTLSVNLNLVYECFEKYPRHFFGDVVISLMCYLLGYSVGPWAESYSAVAIPCMMEPDGTRVPVYKDNPSILHPVKK